MYKCTCNSSIHVLLSIWVTNYKKPLTMPDRQSWAASRLAFTVGNVCKTCHLASDFVATDY